MVPSCPSINPNLKNFLSSLYCSKNLYPNSEELMRLKDKEKYLIMENNRLNQDNEQLKTSLDLFEKNTIFRILKRIFF